jgi:hypothetical protein
MIDSTDVTLIVTLLTPLMALLAHQWGRGKTRTIQAQHEEIKKLQGHKSAYITELFTKESES